MNKRKIELFKFKIDTVSRYNGIYQDFLKEAVVSEDGITEGFVELYGIESACDVYASTYKIDGSGFLNGLSEYPVPIRMDVVYRCARLMYCVYDKSPAKRSKSVSKSNGCVIGSYGLKHVLEYWLGRLSGNTVAKPCESAADSYVSNGEAIMACLVLRDQFEDWPSPAVLFNIKSHGLTPNLECIKFNSKFRKFLSRELDFFTEKDFEFGNDVDGNLVSYPKFNEKNFKQKLYNPSNIWGEHLAHLNISRSMKCR